VTEAGAKRRNEGKQHVHLERETAPTARSRSPTKRAIYEPLESALQMPLWFGGTVSLLTDGFHSESMFDRCDAL
jgi:hypothetical protein